MAWLGMALIALARRVANLEDRMQGQFSSPLSYRPGDPVPKLVDAQTADGNPAKVHLGGGCWLIVFATEGCSACHRTVGALSELLEIVPGDAPQAAVFMPQGDGNRAYPSTPQPEVPHEERLTTSSWLQELSSEETDLVFLLPLAAWLDWAPQGTPTIASVRGGHVVAIDTGITTSSRLVEFWLASSAPGYEMSEA